MADQVVNAGEQPPKPFSICGRYGPVHSEANGYFWMKVVVSVVVLISSVFVSFYGKDAVAALHIPGLVSAAYFLSGGFAMIAVPAIASCVRCKAMRNEIKFDWDLCCSKENGAASLTDEQIQAKVVAWQRKVRRAAAFIPNKTKEKGDQKNG